MKKFFAVVVILVFSISLNSQTTDFKDVDDQEGYCKDFAKRGANMEWDDSNGTMDFQTYWARYNDWYDLCMDVHS